MNVIDENEDRIGNQLRYERDVYRKDYDMLMNTCQEDAIRAMYITLAFYKLCMGNDNIIEANHYDQLLWDMVEKNLGGMNAQFTSKTMKMIEDKACLFVDEYILFTETRILKCFTLDYPDIKDVQTIAQMLGAPLEKVKHSWQLLQNEPEFYMQLKMINNLPLPN